MVESRYELQKEEEVKDEYISTFNRTLESQMFNELREEYEFPKAICRSLTRMFKRYLDLYFGGRRKEGEIIYQAVSKDVPPGKSMEEATLKSVRLSVFSDRDVIIASEEGQEGLLEHRIKRLTNQALEQGVLLTQADLSAILGESTRTILRHIKKMEENGELIPTRGKWKDIGSGESHKKKIIELYLKGYEYTDIVQRTKHSTEAIMRYVKIFARILVLSEEGYSDNEIRMMADVSMKTVQGYKELIEEYDSEEYQERLDHIRAIFQKKEDPQAMHLQEIERSDKEKRSKR